MENSKININEIIVNPGAERMILASCIQNNDLIIEYETQGLSPKHFSVEANKIIFNAIMYLFTSNAKIDALSIINIVKDDKAKKLIEDYGGLEYLMLLQASPISLNTSMFCNEVMTQAMKRQIYKACEDIQQEVLADNKHDNDELINIVNQKINDVTASNSKTDEAYKMGSKLGERLNKIAQDPNPVPGLPTGWTKFDRLTKGGQAGDLIMVVAESKTGKSVTLLNWAKYQAIDLGLPVLYIDTEQLEEEQEFRLLSIVSQIPEDEITTGMFMQNTGFGTAKEKIRRIQEAQQKIEASKLFHVYMPNFTFEKINAVVRQFVLKEGIVALYFDYIKLNPALYAATQRLRDDVILTFLTSALKNLGGQMRIPVYSASQENRTQWGGTEKDAKAIGGSLGILQLATKLIFLRNKTEDELAMQDGTKGNQKLMIKYQRHGQPEDIDIHFDRIRLTQRECET